MNASTPSLSVHDLALERGERVLFERVSFTLEGGDALLVRGPNGVGKTSLLLTLAGSLRAAGGEIAYIAGPEANLAADTHLLLPASGIKPRLTVAENLGFWRAVNGATGLEVAAALELVGLGGLGVIEAGHLSTGQVRRLALTRLVVSRRPVWLLDEPTSALDAEGEALVGRLVAEHCAEGGMAVVATHQDIPALASRGAETLQLGAAP